MLTPNQNKLLDILIGFQKRGDPCPSYGELAERLGVNKGRVHDMTTALKQRGFITFIPYAHHSIEVLRNTKGEYLNADSEILRLQKENAGLRAHISYLNQRLSGTGDRLFLSGR